MTNVIHGFSRLALGLPSITRALIARCYDEPSGLFLPAVEPRISSRIPITVAALSPFALPDLPDEIGHRLAGVFRRGAWRALLGIAGYLLFDVLVRVLCCTTRR